MRKLFLSMAVAAALFATSARAETVNCTEIKPLPFVITAPGVYCLKRNRALAVPSGNAIEIQTNFVTVDLNGFVLRGEPAGPATGARGIFAQGRRNITIRNGTIRGFFRGVFLDLGAAGNSSGHLLEDLLFEVNRQMSIRVEGSDNVIRNNRVVNTGSGDRRTAAFGIFVQSSRRTVIANNIVSGTSETGLVEGIQVRGSTLVDIRGNIILDTKDGVNKLGIRIDQSQDVTVIGNQILNAAGTGTTGVDVTGSDPLSTGIYCIDNIIAGFATALDGCDVDLRNDKLGEAP